MSSGFPLRTGNANISECLCWNLPKWRETKFYKINNNVDVAIWFSLTQKCYFDAAFYNLCLEYLNTKIVHFGCLKGANNGLNHHFS